MTKVLFVCTANIHRSRFAEEVFNYFSEKNKKSASAFSAGLRVGDYNFRKIYYPALDNLEKFNILPKRADELSVHINNIDLNQYDRLICMDKNEHKPMVQSDSHLSTFKFEYWDITDMPKVDSNISLPKCYKQVESLWNQVFSN